MNLARFTRLWGARSSRPARKAHPTRVRPEVESLETRITPATRTWVSGLGDDVNPGSRTAPCKTFAGAISKTDPGGEIDALDPGGFGAVTITKAVTIDGAGQLAGILVAGTNGIIVAAGANDVVILRGLNFDGANQTGLDAIRITSAKKVIIEDCTIENFSKIGIDFICSTPNSQLIVRNTVIRDCLGGGVQVVPQGGAAATATLTGVRSEVNQFGVLAGNNATVNVSDSVAAANQGYGFLAAPTGSAPVQLNLQNALAANNGTNGIASVGAGTVVTLTGVSAFGNSGQGAITSNGGSLFSLGDNHITDNNKGFAPVAIGPGTGGGGATRTWVSGVGDDANPASRTAPAKTFAGAISKTASGGEINVIDPGGFGALTITRSITVDGTGTFASILSSLTNGIIVTAPANAIVILRNLTINGAGTGIDGIRVNGAGSVLIENCVIENVTGAGINFQPTNTGARLIVTNTRIENCGGAGIDVHPTATGSAFGLIDGVQVLGNTVGVKVEDRADVTVFNSYASGNASHGLQVLAASAGATLNVAGGVSSGNGGNGLQAQGSAAAGATGNVAGLTSGGNTLPAFGTGATNSFLSFIGPNQQFVEALYLDFLKRSGDATNASDAGMWANALKNGTMTQAQVATTIARSAEALGVLVDGLYFKFLNRASDPAGRAGFVGQLQGGGTIEQVISGMVSTGEYAALVGTDTGFVQSLYSKLLGRTPSAGELSSTLSSLAMLGRAGLANAFLAGAEFRGDVVQALYGYTPAPASSVNRLLPPLLHRTEAPAASEVNGWVGSGLDVLSIELALAGTPEFFGGA